MKHITRTICQNATKKLHKALDRVEQIAQAIRWQITNMPDDLSNSDAEIGRLTGESSLVAKLFGEFAALKNLEQIDKGNYHQCDCCEFGLLERCEQCFCLLCEDCWRELGDRILCEECHDSLADDEADIEPAASPDKAQSTKQAA